jgi:hypothetical protein
MATPLDLSQTVTQYLTHETVGRLFHQMGSSLDNEMMLNDYQAYVQVIAWSILDKLKISDSFPVSQLVEDNVKPIVDSAIKDMCTIVPQDLEYPHFALSCFTSRVIWWSLKLSRRELG